MTEYNTDARYLSDADAIERHAAEAKRKLDEVEQHVRAIQGIGYHTPDVAAHNYARSSLTGLHGIAKRVATNAAQAQQTVIDRQ